MKYIIEIPDKDIDKYKLGNDEMTIPVRIGMSDFRIGIGTGINLTPYDESEAEQCGADKAWKLARHLYNVGSDVTEAIYWSMNGGKGLGVALEMPYAEAQAEYDAWQERKNEIHVGDEVASNYEEGIRFAVTCVRDGSMDGINFANGESYTYRSFKQWHKTGRNFPELIELIEKMKESK